MRLGNAEDVRRRNLAMLLSKACRTYTNEVLERHKLYDRFADDFINLHRYTDCVCALGKNGHCTNLHIVEGILTTRKDLVIRYFVNKALSLEQLETLVREYDTTVPPIQAYPRQSTRLDYAPPAFGCYFGQKEISLITHYAYNRPRWRLEACLRSF